MNKTTKLNPMLTIAAILLCLVLISTYMTSGLYAKYADKGTADASARVATFVIETDLDRISLGTSGAPTLQLGGDEEIQVVELPFYIASGSEVEVGYSITVDFGTTPLPDYMNITLSDGITSKTPVANIGRTTFTFSDFGTLPATTTEEQAELTLTFSISDLTMITEEVFIPTAELKVKVYQID